MTDKEDSAGAKIVVWSEKYATYVEVIDAQHKELFDLINRLYSACVGGGAEIDSAFRKAMHSMVEYVKFHFAQEIGLLEKIGYPDLAEHKKQHEELAHIILGASSSYEKGSTFVPNKFVRTLRDWVLSHIGVHDRAYAEYIAGMRKKGLLTDL